VASALSWVVTKTLPFRLLLVGNRLGRGKALPLHLSPHSCSLLVKTLGFQEESMVALLYGVATLGLVERGHHYTSS